MKLIKIFALWPFLLAPLSQAVSQVKTPVFPIYTIVPDMRPLIGKSLLDTAVKINNERPFILETLNPQGATFFLGGKKAPGEVADALRHRTTLSVVFTTCSGSQGLEGKISAISVWERIDEDGDGDVRMKNVATGMQQMLEIVNTPPTVVTPSTLRSPKASQLQGLVYEYTRGDTTETVSLTDELGSTGALDPQLRVSWSITNTSICPK